jgi:hypothetical protein
LRKKAGYRAIKVSADTAVLIFPTSSPEESTFHTIKNSFTSAFLPLIAEATAAV